MEVSSDNPDIITFSWLISGAATKYNGSLNFAIRFYCLSDESEIEYSWGTNIYSGIKVSNGLDNSETIVEDYVDVLEKWKQDVIDICSTNSMSDDDILECLIDTDMLSAVADADGAILTDENDKILLM